MRIVIPRRFTGSETEGMRDVPNLSFSAFSSMHMQHAREASRTGGRGGGREGGGAAGSCLP